MPTVLALDVSLSMCRPVKTDGEGDDFNRKNLAIQGLSTLLDSLSTHCKLEFTSLVVFSYLWELLVPFTRDVDSIKAALNTVGDYSKTCFEPVLNGVSTVVVDEWGTTSPTQIIMVTDGNSGVGPGSLKAMLDGWEQGTGEGGEKAASKCPLPYPFKGKLHVVCIANQNDPDLKKSMPLYQKLIDLSEMGGELFIPDGTLSMTSVSEMFTNLTEKFYVTYRGVLSCGHLKCAVSMFPPPEPYSREDEYETIEAVVSDNLEVCEFMDFQDVASPPTISRHLVLPLEDEYETIEAIVSDNLEICGFMDIQDVASPPTISRHLVLPVSAKQKTPTATKPADTDSPGDKPKEDEDSDGHDDGKTPSFTVLLHGSLKVEGMVAVTRVTEGWYGILYSWADSKKKSSLMLSLFEPGPECITWLGNLNYLAPISDFSEPPYGDDDNRTPFPVRPKEKRSYAQSCVVWIKAIGLQADLQKVIRHARKLPDKQQQFYKELNRIRKAALSFGFTELLEAMGTMLQRECTMLPGTAHPEAALQLTHAATKLCSDAMATDPTQTILPMRTNFSQEDG